MRNIAYEILSIIHHYAPNASAQIKATIIYNRLMEANSSDMEIETQMVGILYKGVTVGLWPWNT